MQPRSGFEVLNELRADPRTAKVPILVVSVLDVAERALAEGADAFVLKPFRPEQLLERVRQLVGSTTA